MDHARAELARIEALLTEGVGEMTAREDLACVNHLKTLESGAIWASDDETGSFEWSAICSPQQIRVAVWSMTFHRDRVHSSPQNRYSFLRFGPFNGSTSALVARRDMVAFDLVVDGGFEGSGVIDVGFHQLAQFLALPAMRDIVCGDLRAMLAYVQAQFRSEPEENDDHLVAIHEIKKRMATWVVGMKQESLF